jgi:N-acetyl-anhydromuramoyl-L-alanine amidase
VAATAAFSIDADGWLRAARRVVSPNQDARPADTAIELVVVHSISLPPGVFAGDAIEHLFTNTLDLAAHPYYAGLAGLRVSAHCLVRRDGALTQFVPFAARAWHAGVSMWRERARCNDFSVGIELEGTDASPFEPAQYRTLTMLIGALRARYPIAAIAGHSDIAPGRKSDPGSGFDWGALAQLLDRA